MKRLIIAIDCDDVLMPTAEAIINDYNARFATKLELGHMYQPASIESWGTDSDDEAIKRVNDFLRSDAHAQIKPYPEAIEAIRLLSQMHELHLVTGRASFLEQVTARMLDVYFQDCFQSVEHTNYIVTSDDKTSIRRTKGEVCRSIGARVLIDDHVHHGRSVLEAGLEGVIVFGDYPWNRNSELSDRMVRCLDWPSTLKEITRIAYG
jgi:5'(3')-deoxyribonucleotidase